MTVENRVRDRPARGIDDVGGPKASEISELRRKAKWREHPEEIEEEDDLLTGEGAPERGCEV